MNLRALVVAYAFPPVGGAGVQRVAKLVKYLPQHGVTPSVLTVQNPSAPLRDDSLERDLPKAIEIVRAPTWEPGYQTKARALRAARAERGPLSARLRAPLVKLARRFVVPDVQVLWLPGASRALLGRILSDRPDDVVFISGPPFSQFCLAALARVRPGTAVVLDYRDEWSRAPTVDAAAGRASSMADQILEPALLRLAHAVTTATEAFRLELLGRFSFLDPARVHTIPNGYDPDDFPPNPGLPPSDRFVVSYAGTVFPLTSPRGLLDAVRLLHEREPQLATKLELRFIGRIVESEDRWFEGTEKMGVRRLGYLPHTQALGELTRSHAAVCILDDVRGAERVYPAKIFEIMHLRRPCLVLAPSGALADLARHCRVGEVVAPRNADAIALVLARMLRAFRDGKMPAFSEPVDIERFDRRRLATEFSSVFRQAVRAAKKTPRGATSPLAAADTGVASARSG
jgi:glycosyltransferase involved in cell wall biosynthesis